MRLIITRHGETKWNVEQKFQGGRSDIRLSEKGLNQSKRLGVRLAGENIGVIYSSPLKRALDTARVVNRYQMSAEFLVKNDLREMDYGIFEGLSVDEVKEKYSEMWVKRESDKYNFKTPDGESYKDVDERVLGVLEGVVGSRRTSLIVAHGSVNRMLLKYLVDGYGLGVCPEPLGAYQVKNCSVSLFEVNDEVRSIELNSCWHLED